MLKEKILETEAEFLIYVEDIMKYNEAINVLTWDLRTKAPKKGVEQRSKVIGMLSSNCFKMSTSKKMSIFIETLTSPKAKNYISNITKKMLEECKRKYELNKKIPSQEYKEYVILTSKAESKWEIAKERSDFSILVPYLEKIVNFNKRFVDYWGYTENKYNTLLDIYEPGLTVKSLDDIFNRLRNAVVPLVKEIGKSKRKVDYSLLFASLSLAQQKEFIGLILQEFCYNFDAGRLDQTAHPFTLDMNLDDVRVTTKYIENDFRASIFSAIHECGHALYEQNISKKLSKTNLRAEASMGIHESQAIFLEKIVGKSFSFWERNYKKMIEHSGDYLNTVSLEEFFFAINQPKPSSIRLEADELTYPLHIMIRYEIEKDLINGSINVKDLPSIWNDKYQKYLGVSPKDDAEGILQDVHWAVGLFGYFPSYGLGYIYAAQFKNAAMKDLPDFDDLIKNGQFNRILDWLIYNIYRYGKTKKPLELLHDVTGEGINPQYLIEYLVNKYKHFL
ncbi:carboxypeptidase [Priestia megaterium]|uniref:Metal-dependent carboxypeptidase n=1 Tax=Priestia megaterium TaxID=1404 RepID=A0AAX6BSZ6_PRIMG|nr:carboxypeptidase M32 [Priestia megaterium]GMG76936.1 carboxypeptidase [Priestia megaterium]